MVPSGLSNVMAIAAGEFHSLAIKSDGTVVGWGDNWGAETPPTGLGSLISVAGGGDFSVGLWTDLRILSIGATVQGPQLSFQTFAGRQYAPEYRPQLNSGSWSPVPGGPVAGNGRVVTVTDTNSLVPARRFYRIKQW